MLSPFSISNKPISELFLTRLAISFLVGALGFSFNAIMVEINQFSAANLSLVRTAASVITIVIPIWLGSFIDSGVSSQKTSFIVFVGAFFWIAVHIPINLVGWATIIGFLGAYSSIGDMLLARSIPIVFKREHYQKATAALFATGALVSAFTVIGTGQVIEYLGYKKFAYIGVGVSFLTAIVIFLVTRSRSEYSFPIMDRKSPNMFEGFRISIQNRDIRILLIYSFISVITFTAVETLLFIFLSNIIGLSVSTIAIVYSARALTSAFAPIAAINKTISNFGVIFFFLSVVGAATWIIFGMFWEMLNIPMLIVLVSLPAATSALFNVFAATFRQIVIPAEFQGQSMAATRAIMWSSMPLSGLFIFYLSSNLDINHIFIIVGAVQLLGSALLLKLRNN